MTAPACPRLWEAEAVEDGRLDRIGRAAFERHAAVCAECAREVAWLDELRNMRSLSVVEPSPMQKRRLRGAILREANARIVRPAVGRTRALLAVTAALALLIGLLGRRSIWQAAGVPALSTVSADSGDAIFDIAPGEHAQWRVVQVGPRARVSLTAGTLSVHVQKLRAGQRFVVSLPDGELEVRGTRFEVVVRDRATAQVRVTEGVVALRIDGSPQRLLAAGATWTRSVERLPTDAPMATASSGASADAVPSARSPNGTNAEIGSRGSEPNQEASERARDEMRAPPARDRMRAPSAGRTGRAAAVSEARDREGAGAEGATDPSHDDGAAGVAFREAMAAFDAGAFAEADQKLARFEQEFGADARAEDASFLRVVCALRRGDRKSAVARARAYLAAHPNGLRRAAVEDLLRRKKP